MDKSELIKRIKAGETAAFEYLFKITHLRLVSYARLFIPEQNEAEDIVQDCFLKLWEKRKTLQDKQAIESFLFVMLRHRCLNYLRDQKLSVSIDTVSSWSEVDLQHLFELDFTGIENKSIEEELIEAIKREIELLPEKRKQVFVYSKLEGLKNKEIAEKMGISIKAVEKHMHQAKLQLKSRVGTQYPDSINLLSLVFA